MCSGDVDGRGVVWECSLLGAFAGACNATILVAVVTTFQTLSKFPEAAKTHLMSEFPLSLEYVVICL